ncbi:PapG chaperone-binding domain-containing protein [Aeromonas hydrophila]|uniref:MrpH family fimbial adhesin n=1 Tax=Aeromonas hydrophila TaxID=644 RepID=UPI0029D4492E|nr:PapG chaperone-binding domain-containing protein [Aeromonas hydrophila]MDX7780545.1 PapG chaperone-binding domain-containing protein [Aeromonas hydrophila]
MKKILYLLIFLSWYAEAAIIASNVTLSTGNVATVNYFSTNTTDTSSGDLYAQGMRWFGLAAHVVRFADGTPTPQENFASLFGSALTVPILPGETWADVSQKFITKFGPAGAHTSPWGFNKIYVYEACAAASICNDCGASGTSVRIYSGSCSSVPWTPIACNIGNTSLLIDHGTLNIDEVNGHSATTTTSVTCDSSATIRFRLSDQRPNLGNGIYSDIYINNQGFTGAVGNINYSVPSSGLPLTIESRLVSSNPQPGLFSGSVVIIMDVL